MELERCHGGPLHPLHVYFKQFHFALVLYYFVLKWNSQDMFCFDFFSVSFGFFFLWIITFNSSQRQLSKKNAPALKILTKSCRVKANRGSRAGTGKALWSSSLPPPPFSLHARCCNPSCVTVWARIRGRRGKPLAEDFKQTRLPQGFALIVPVQRGLDADALRHVARWVITGLQRMHPSAVALSAAACAPLFQHMFFHLFLLWKPPRSILFPAKYSMIGIFFFIFCPQVSLFFFNPIPLKNISKFLYLWHLPQFSCPIFSAPLIKFPSWKRSNSS